MGISVGNGPRGRRKSLDADLNLVPYIDLLTCMIAFLLIAAVWTQLSRLQVQQRGQGEAGDETAPLQTRLAVLVHEQGFTLIVGSEQRPLPATPGHDTTALTGELRRFKVDHPDKLDVQILSDDAIKFETLVKVMDAALSAGFPSISLQDAAVP